MKYIFTIIFAIATVSNLGACGLAARIAKAERHNNNVIRMLDNNSNNYELMYRELLAAFVAFTENDGASQCRGNADWILGRAEALAKLGTAEAVTGRCDDAMATLSALKPIQEIIDETDDPNRRALDLRELMRKTAKTYLQFCAGR